MAAETTSLPAPIGGWNAFNALGEMPVTDAIVMENYWPLVSDVMVRKGYSQFSTGFASTVESLMVYRGPTSQKLFAASNNAIYDATSGGAIGTAAVTGTTNNRWQYANITTAGGSYMLCVNGAEKLRGFDGTSWWQDGDATHDITGVNTNLINNICLHMQRIWLLEGASLKVWYLGLQSIGGAATLFDLTSIARKGGYLVGMDAWTLDAGAGMNNYAAFFTSNGEVLVYTGTDPALDLNSGWSLMGIWEIGAPMGPRSHMKWAGDLLLITYDGVVPMSEDLQSSRLDPRVAISNKIYAAIGDATRTYGKAFGWDMLYYPKADMLIINVPVTGGAEQYVMNTINKSWANFTGWNASCWALFNDEPYFGGPTYIGKAWDTYADNGATITGNCQQAYTYFTQNRAVEKRFTMARPVLFTSGSNAALIGMNTDFDNSTLTGTLAVSAGSSALWDSAIWDTSVWGGGLTVSKNWYGLQGMGYCGSINMKIATNGAETHWVSTDIVYEQGAII